MVDGVASTRVTTGDGVRARMGEVVRVIQERVGAVDAATCFVDRTPRPAPADTGVAIAVRDRGAGRPTKRDRRMLERLRRLSQ
jgi:ribosome-associated heat shock protein Hsp15